MSGSFAIGNANPNLPSLFPSSPAGGNAGSLLLSALYGGGGAPAANPVTALRTAEQTQTKSVTAQAQLPAVQRDTQAFAAAVESATSVSSLLANPVFQKVLLTASGLADQLPYPALVTKTLASDVNGTSSLVNQLNNASFKTVVQTYDFANKGLSVIQQPKVIATIVNAYAEQLWRNSLDAATPGLSNALTFRAQAASITSVDQILGDSTLRTVVTTALNIPEQIAFQPLGAQESAISSQVDIKQFQDPKFVETFAQRYLIQTGIAAAGAGSAPIDLGTLAVQASGLVV